MFKLNMQNNQQGISWLNKQEVLLHRSKTEPQKSLQTSNPYLVYVESNDKKSFMSHLGGINTITVLGQEGGSVNISVGNNMPLLGMAAGYCTISSLFFMYLMS